MNVIDLRADQTAQNDDEEQQYPSRRYVKTSTPKATTRRRKNNLEIDDKLPPASHAHQHKHWRQPEEPIPAPNCI